MRERLAAEHVPVDTSDYWREMAEKHGGAAKLHRSVYLNTQHRLRIRMMMTLCEVTPGESCVEPGCGAGHITKGLAKLFDRVDAFDSCAEMVAEAPEIEGVTYTVADADRWLPTQGHYDVGFLSEILEHVRNPKALVQRCANVCDFIIASAPVEEPLAGERAFSVEARSAPTMRSDGSGHIWAWDWDGFAELFGEWPRMVQALTGQHGVIMVHCV